MEMLLNLISSLKLNDTIFTQFVVFLVGYSVLYFVLFKPYNKAAQTRYDRTTGSEDSADKYSEEIELLKRKYGEKVKSTNAEVGAIFSQYDEKAKKESADLLLKAQTDYKAEKDQREKAINDHYEQEKNKVPALTKEIKDQLKKVLAGV